jgi:hypothetical protein
MTDKKTDVDLQLSGISSPTGLSRPIAGAEILVPLSVSLCEYGIHYQFDSGSCPARRIRQGPGMLDAFIQLRDAPDEAILRFTRRWGVLEICKHFWPNSFFVHCEPDPKVEHAYCEPTAGWRLHASIMYTVLKAASQVTQGRLRSPINWECFREFLDVRSSELFSRTGVNAEREKIENVLNLLVATAGLRLVVRFKDAPPRIELRGGSRSSGSGLYGALVADLIVACVKAKGAHFCSNCGNSYAPKRRPSPTRRSYCRKCRLDGVPGRDAARDYRARTSK